MRNLRSGQTFLERRRGIRIVWLVAALLWGLLATVVLLRARGEPWLWQLFAELRFAGVSWPLVRTVFGAALLRVGLFVPLGILCALAFGQGAGRRMVGLALAWLVAFAAAGFVGGLEWRIPGLLEFALPALGCVLGVVLAGAFWKAPARWAPSLALRATALVAAGALAALLLMYALLAAAPAPVSQAEISSAQKRALVAELRRHNPLKLAGDQATELAFSPEQLQAALAWGVLLLDRNGRAAVRGVGEELLWRASVRLPAGMGARRYLAVGGGFGLASDGRRLRISRCALSIGSVGLGPWGCRALMQSLHRLAFATPEHRVLVASLESLRLDGQGLATRYGRVQLDDEFRGRLQALLGPGWETRAAARAQFDLLREEGARLAANDDRFGAVLQATFGLAAQRSLHGGAVAENQGAILALATVLGHPDVATMAGIERPEDWRDIRGVLWPVRLRQRADWTQHFLVSAAITQASTAVVSDAAGLLKEELDAAGGSGFSFGDLLADRAGTVFGEAASRDEDSARGLQRLVLDDYRVERLMPPGADLPEGISDAELQRRYGGVGGPLYREVLADIESRITRVGPSQLLEKNK